MRSLILSVLLSTGLLAVGALGAAAQDRPAGASAPAHVIDLGDTIVIYGRQQQPGAQYVLARGRDGVEVRELRTSFVRDVVHSVQEGPF